MHDDFKMVIHKLPIEYPYINIYPIADVHIGSKECDIKLFQTWIDTVKNDEYGYCVLAGDLMNMGLKASKTNIYEEVLTPQQQKDTLYKMLIPIKDKILGAVSGNHEYRSVKETGINPLYDVFCRLQIEDLYRENACFMKVNLGQRSNKQRQISYGIVLHHGASRNKKEKWANAIDGMDCLITGHTHIAEMQPPCKMIMDMKNEVIRMMEYTTIVCNSFQDYGGYSLRGMYLPQASKRFQKIILNGTKKHIGFEFK